MSSAKFDKNYCFMEVNLNRCSASFEVEHFKNKIMITFITYSGVGEASIQNRSYIVIDKENTKVLESFFRKSADKVAEWNA